MRAWLAERARRLMRGGKRSFALNELDLKLDRMLGGLRNGFFIEAGGNDGLTQSNSLYFERYRGWRGLLVEPIPDLAKSCRANRPGALVENAALVPFGFEATTVQMRYCNLMSLVKGGMGSAEVEDKHIAAGTAVQGIESYEIQVPARTLQSILDLHGIVRADLFTLDVEGFEAQVLRGIDFDRFVAMNLLIEVRDKDEIERILAGRYMLAAELSHHDLLYRPVRQT